MKNSNSVDRRKPQKLPSAMVTAVKTPVFCLLLVSSFSFDAARVGVHSPDVNGVEATYVVAETKDVVVEISDVVVKLSDVVVGLCLADVVTEPVDDVGRGVDGVVGAGVLGGRQSGRRE